MKSALDCLGGLLAHLGHGLAPQGGQHPLQDSQIALASGVHHPGLFQDGVHVGGLGQHLVAHADGLCQHVLHVVVLPGSLCGPLGSQAGDGQHGALGGLHHRAVGGGHALLHSRSQKDRVGSPVALEDLGHTPEEEGEDDAGVAPGSPEEGSGGSGGGLSQVFGVALFQLGGGGADGEAHVGAGVAVGDGEYVEVVDLLLLQRDSGGAVEDHPLELDTIDRLYHLSVKPPWHWTQQSLHTRPRSSRGCRCTC